MIADDLLHPLTFCELVEDELSLGAGGASIADGLCDDVLRLLLDGRISSPAEPGRVRAELPHLRIVDLGFLVARQLLFGARPNEPARSVLELAREIRFGALLAGLAEPAAEIALAVSLLDYNDGPPSSLLAQQRRQHGTDEDSNFVSLAVLAAADVDEPRGFDDPMTLALAVLNGALARDYKLPVALCLAQLTAVERGETLSSLILEGWRALTEVTAVIDVSRASTKRDKHRISQVYGSSQTMTARGAWLLAGAHFLSVSVSEIDARSTSGESWEADAVIHHSEAPEIELRTASDIKRLATAAGRWLRERCQLSECHFEVRAEVE